MKTTKDLLGARIKELRKRRGLTQEQLAEMIGVDPKHIGKIEGGRGYPSLDALENIARSLEIDLKDFFTFEHLETINSVRKSVKARIEAANEEDLRRIQRVLDAILN